MSLTAAAVILTCILGAPVAGVETAVQAGEPAAGAEAARARESECAPNWEPAEELCYPACPVGYGGTGSVCRQNCPPDYVDEGATCRRDADVVARATRPRGTPHLERSAYRDLFVSFVQLYRAGAALLAQPLTEDERTYLRQFFPERLIDRVRLTVVPSLTLPFLLDVRATTIGDDLIVVKDGQRSNSLLKHELVHVCQADQLGLDKFMREYADQYVDGGYDYNQIRFEKEAYAFDAIGGPISGHLGYCD